MKKNLLFFLFFTFALKAFALSDKFSFSMGADTGVINGSIKEYVLDFDRMSNPYILSRLDWDLENITYFGMHADFCFNHFYSNIGFKGGFSGTCGSMNDYDWLDSFDTSKLTNHSWHTNSLSSYVNLSFNAGWKFFLPAKITLTPLVGFEVEDVYFEGTDGAYKYLNSDGITFNEGNFTGKVISYEQTYKTLKLGLLTQTTIIPHINFDLAFFICPGFDIDGTDHHYLTKVYYWDKMENGVMYEVNGKIAVYLLENHVLLGINGGLQYIPLMSGNTYTRKTIIENWANSFGTGGTDRFLWNLGASLTFIL